MTTPHHPLPLGAAELTARRFGRTPAHARHLAVAAIDRWLVPVGAASRILAAAVAVLAAIAGLTVTSDRAIDLDAWSRLCAEVVDHPICEPEPVGLEFSPPGAELDRPPTRP